MVQEAQRTLSEAAMAIARTVPLLQPSGTDEPPRDWVLSGADETLRGLYTRAGIGFAPEVLTVSSALAGEGKTTVSLGLALTFAQDYPERRVVLVETDFERPCLADDFGLEPTPGLVDYLTGEQPLEVAFRATFLDNLHLVPVGAQTRFGRALRSNRMFELIEALRQNYDLVVLDAPAVLPNSDAVILSDIADATLIVVRAGATPSLAVKRALEQIDESKLRGVILNGSKSAIPGWLRRLAGM